MDLRATSTVLDVAVFLLLVGAAIGTLVAGTDAVADTGRSPAAERAELVVTTTATVEYRVAHERGSDALRTRRAHGTLASHLASSALGRAAYRGTRLSNRSYQYDRAVSRAVAGRLTDREVAANVTAVWDPTRDGPFHGRTTAGRTPPPAADVDAATVRAPTGLAPSPGRLRGAAQNDGYAGVARVVAETIVEGLYPTNGTTAARRGGQPFGNYTHVRYQGLIDATGASPGEAETVAAINPRVIDLVASDLEAALRAEYDTPAAAARGVEPGSVRITVRTWSP